MFQAGHWLILDGPRGFVRFTSEMADEAENFAIGEVLSFRCGDHYNRAKDSSFVCVQEGPVGVWARCLTKKCTKFSRDQIGFEGVFKC